MELRYMGFDQERNTRIYRFNGLEKGQPPVHIVVTADLGLFLANRVAIQDGPDLCALKIAANVRTPCVLNHELTGEDLRAHANARAEAEARRAARRQGGPRRKAAEA
jgi:hypothetical protein